MKASVDVVDAAGGNIGSVCRALDRLNVSYRRVNGQRPPDGSRPIVLPGVGSFGAVMSKLSEDNLAGTIIDLATAGVPVLGICVGLQVLFQASEESPGIAGLGLFSGSVTKFRQGKIPQIGWNYVSSREPGWTDGYVYFVNSFYAQPACDDVVLYRGDYYEPFCAAVQSNNITAFQFHPEKSGAFGMNLLSRWLQNVSN